MEKRLLEGGAERLVPDLARTAPGTSRARSAKAGQPVDQLGLFVQPVQHEVVHRLRAIEVNELTPLAALQLVAELVDQAKT